MSGKPKSGHSGHFSRDVEFHCSEDFNLKTEGFYKTLFFRSFPPPFGGPSSLKPRGIGHGAVAGRGRGRRHGVFRSNNVQNLFLCRRKSLPWPVRTGFRGVEHPENRCFLARFWPVSGPKHTVIREIGSAAWAAKRPRTDPLQTGVFCWFSATSTR